jgi:hypothetical protein
VGERGRSYSRVKHLLSPALASLLRREARELAWRLFAAFGSNRLTPGAVKLRESSGRAGGFPTGLNGERLCGMMDRPSALFVNGFPTRRIEVRRSNCIVMDSCRTNNPQSKTKRLIRIPPALLPSRKSCASCPPSESVSRFECPCGSTLAIFYAPSWPSNSTSPSVFIPLNPWLKTFCGPCSRRLNLSRFIVCALLRPSAGKSPFPVFPLSPPLSANRCPSVVKNLCFFCALFRAHSPIL